MSQGFLDMWKKRSAGSASSMAPSIKPEEFAAAAEIEEYRVEDHEKAMETALTTLQKNPHAYAAKQAWLNRRAQSDVDAIVDVAVASYKRDRAMGLNHEKAMDHAAGSWQTIINLRRELAGKETLSPEEIATVTQRMEQVIAGENGASGNKPEDWVIAHALPVIKTAGDAARDYSCVMVNVTDPEVKKVFDAIVASIPDEDVYDPEGTEKYGREDRMHITVKYGLHTQDADEIRPMVENFGPIEATLKGVSFFRKEGKDYDVLKFDIDSDDLPKLRKEIEDAVETTDEHPVYHAHSTIAYLKRGTAEKYSGDTEFAKNAVKELGGTGLVFDSVCFSDKNSDKVEISCVKKASSKWRLHLAKAKKNPACEKETALIRENKKKPEAKKKHDFKPAKWTHPNGHPRCLTCGQEETIGGVCNKTPSAKDYADFQAELDAEFPEAAKQRREVSAMYERGEITYTEFRTRVAMTDASERLLGEYYTGKITQTDLDVKLRRLRAAA